jgi:hypothetical protein
MPLVTTTTIPNLSYQIKPLVSREKPKPNHMRKNHVESRHVAFTIYHRSPTFVSRQCYDFFGELEVNPMSLVSSPCRTLTPELYGSKIRGL